MRIAYWTIDEVNLSLARDLAGVHDATTDQVTWKDRDSSRDADAVLYDLDALAATMRDDIVSCLVLSPLLLPVAVHSYHLEDAQIELLAARGIAVYRRLEAEVFGNLRAAVLRARSERVIAVEESSQEHPAQAQSIGAALPAMERSYTPRGHE
jgi:hypothetical protein